LKQMRKQRLVETATAANLEISLWQAQLPAFLSGAIHPSSLIPIFQRQLTVLRLAHSHAIMLVNRPLLLRNYARSLGPEHLSQYRAAVQACIRAAQDVVEVIESFVLEDQFFPAFWYTQYIAFNALSILYVYLLQRQKQSNHLLPMMWEPGTLSSDAIIDDAAFFERVCTGHRHLAQATSNAAPSLRYSIVLEELRDEVERGLSQASSLEKSMSISEARSAGGSNALTSMANPNRQYYTIPNGTHADHMMITPIPGKLCFSCHNSALLTMIVPCYRTINLSYLPIV